MQIRPEYPRDMACLLPSYGSSRCTLLASSNLRNREEKFPQCTNLISSDLITDFNMVMLDEMTRDSVVLILRPKLAIPYGTNKERIRIAVHEEEQQQQQEVVLCKMSTPPQKVAEECYNSGSDSSPWLLYYDSSTTYPVAKSISSTASSSVDSPVQLGENCQVQELPCIRVTSCASSLRMGESTSSSMYPVFFYPRCVILPLQSITLIEHPPTNTDRDSTTTDHQLSLDSLQSSCIKRCLVGRLVIKHCITSVILTHSNNVNNAQKIQYEVLQVTAQHHHCVTKLPSTSYDHQVFQILPSTIITISKMHVTSATPICSDNNHSDRDEGQLTLPYQVTTKPASNDLFTSNVVKESFATAKDKSYPLPASSNKTQFFYHNPKNFLFQCMLALHEANCTSLPNKQLLDVPRSFLLTGPPGVGKSYSVQQALKRFQSVNPYCHLISLRGSESYKNLSSVFYQAASLAGQSPQSLSVLFLDEFDALMADMMTVAQLGYLLDRVLFFHSTSSLVSLSKECSTSNSFLLHDSTIPIAWNRVIVIAATNRAQTIPEWLRRRLVREIYVTPPNGNERNEILSTLLSQVDSSELDSETIYKFAVECVGYVAADLAALVKTAALLTTSSIAKDNDRVTKVTVQHLLVAKEQVGASALRDSAIAASSSSTWDDIAGSAGGAKEALRRAVEWPRTKSDAFRLLGLSSPRGVLLYGPPGCAKTSLARAAAGSAGIAFISLSPAEVFASSYVGDAEGIIRRAFSLARSVAPCILFFDEIDAILGTAVGSGSINRRMGRESSSEARVLSTFLNEMDGVDSSPLDGVLVLGATNRPTVLDAALLRPGRFDKVIYVPPPDRAARRSLFSLQLAKVKCCCESIDLDYLASDVVSGKLTGAEIIGACQEALMLVMREVLENNNGGTAHAATPLLTKRHLDQTMRGLKPLLTDRMLAEYKMFEERNKM